MRKQAFGSKSYKTGNRAQNKGFSLLEMVIAMAVSLIALGIITSLAVLLNNAVAKAKILSEGISEVYAVEEAIAECFYRYDSIDFEMSVEKDKIAFTSFDGEHLMMCRDGKLITDNTEIDLDYVSEIVFAHNEESDIVRITVRYKAYKNEELEYGFVLLHHT